MTDLSRLKRRIEQLVKPTDEEWTFLLEDVEAKRLKKGELLWKEGQICKHLVYINEGCVRYYHVSPVSGAEISLQFMFSNSFVIDCPSFINVEKICFNYEALEPTELILLKKERIFEAIQKFRTWERFARIMSEQNAISIQKRKNSLILDSPEEQYLKLMQERPKVVQSIPQHMIATYLGITREHLSRIRKKIAGKGIM